MSVEKDFSNLTGFNGSFHSGLPRIGHFRFRIGRRLLVEADGFQVSNQILKLRDPLMEIRINLVAQLDFVFLGRWWSGEVGSQGWAAPGELPDSTHQD